MAAKKKTASRGASGPEKAAAALPKPLGRRRDHSRDHDILEATIAILAEAGFDAMTMDMVAARAKAGKATLYRRWPSKGELVRDALVWMSRNSVDLDHLPDTGNLRDDLLAVMKPQSLEYSQRKLRVLSGLGSFSSQHQKLYDETLEGIFGPWTEVNTALMRRAVERRELPPGADIALACEIIVSVTTLRTATLRKSFGRDSYADLLDRMLLPGLKG